LLTPGNDTPGGGGEPMQFKKKEKGDETFRRMGTGLTNQTGGARAMGLSKP